MQVDFYSTIEITAAAPLHLPCRLTAAAGAWNVATQQFNVRPVHSVVIVECRLKLYEGDGRLYVSVKLDRRSRFHTHRRSQHSTDPDC